MRQRFLCIALFAIYFCCLPKMAVAEIQSVRITWNPAFCNEGCGKILEQKLKSISAVENIELSQGQAFMDWKPDHKFDYQMLQGPAEYANIAINGIYVKVRGTVKRYGDKVKLTSIGDGTVFDLTSPPMPKYGTYTQYSVPELYKLNPDQLNELSQAAKKDEMVTVSGFLLMPYRLNLTLVLGSINIEKEPNSQLKQQ